MTEASATLLITFPFGDDREDERHQLTPGENLAAAIMRAAPDRWGGQNFELYRGAVVVHGLVPVTEAAQVEVAAGDVWHVVVMPAELISGTAIAASLFAAGMAKGTAIVVGAVLSYAAMTAISMAISFAASMLLAPGKQSDKAAAPADQPTGLNALSPPSNMMRPASRVPDHFGTMRTWPDLLFPAWQEWRPVNWDDWGTNFAQYSKLNPYATVDQDVTAVFCLGRGVLTGTDFRFGETPIAQANGTVTWYPPGSTLPDDVRLPRPVTSVQRIEFPGNRPGVAAFLPWVSIPGSSVSEVWIQVSLPGGLYLAITAGKGPQPPFNFLPTDAVFRVVLQRLVNGAVAEIVQRDFQVVGRSANEGRLTFKVQHLTPGEWQITVGEVATHEPPYTAATRRAALEGIVGFERLSDAHRTYEHETILVVRASNRGGPAIQNLEQFNLVVTRHLPTQAPGQAPGTPGPAGPTRQWLAAAMFTLTDPYTCGYAREQVDWESVLEVQRALDAAGEPEFNGTFDRQMTADEQLQLIARKARAQVFISNGRVTFARDERRAGVSALFNRRNRLADRSTAGLGLRFPGPDEHDAVEITWFDAANDWKVRTYTYPEGLTPANALSIDLVGATSWAEVWRRARYEFALLRYRRRTMPLRVTEEAQLLLPFDRVAIVHPWDEGVIDGEVLEQRGNALRLSRDVAAPLPPGAAIRLRASDGRSTSLHPVVARPDLGDRWVEVLGGGPVVPIVEPTPDRQLGTLFNLSTRDALDKATQWLMAGAEIDERGVTLSLMDDDDRVYSESDDAPVPPAPPILQSY